MFFSLFRTRASARTPLALVAGACLLIGALALAACDTGASPQTREGDPLNQALLGTWKSEFGDSYTIGAETLAYDSGFSDDMNYAGAVRHVSAFTDAAGVIIIEYTKEPVYYDYDAQGNQTNPHKPSGKFIGIYYKGAGENAVEMGQAYAAGGAEQPSLEAARAAFTMENEGTYMSFYGAYKKQP